MSDRARIKETETETETEIEQERLNHASNLSLIVIQERLKLNKKDWN
jgi:hypothetical protein